MSDETTEPVSPGLALFAELIERHAYLKDVAGEEAWAVAAKTTAEYCGILDEPTWMALEKMIRGLVTLAVGLIGHTERLQRLDAALAELKGDPVPDYPPSDWPGQYL